MWVWGEDIDGSLGLNQRNVKISSPTQIPGTTWSLSNIHTNHYTNSFGTFKIE